MRENVVLIEKSFADAIAMIAAAEELPAEKRRHWATSLRQVAEALDRPLEVIPARYSAVRADLINLHEVPAGLTAKTLQNHKSNAKSALLYLAREKGVPEYGAPLMEEWEALKAKIKGSLVRYRLSSFMRFCSANGIKPGEVSESAAERFIDYRSRCGKPADTAFRRLMARAWNANVGATADWPDIKFVEPPVKSTVEIAWSDFPEGLRRDVDSYLEGLTKIRRNRKNQRVRPLKPVTIRTRRAELQGAARVAVKVGVPIENLHSLALLAPEVAEQVLEAYCKRNGEKPKLYTIDLAGRFLSIARETKCLTEADCERLNEMREVLDEDRPEGFTDKNATLIRQVLAPDIWDLVVNLPFRMMAEARRQRARAPVQSAVMAQLAVAIAILTIVPVRIKNLTEIRLGLNLSKPGRLGSDYWLNFPDYDVKNRMKLDYALDEYITPLIDEYIHDFWPILLRGRNEDYLFPGMRSGAKGKVSFSGQITKRVLKLTGLRITAHQFRHAAGAIILQEQPGNCELVRQILGHRSLSTTIRCYVWLKSIQAHQIYQKMVRKRLKIDPEGDNADEDSRQKTATPHSAELNGNLGDDD
jgi:Phage integrase family